LGRSEATLDLRGQRRGDAPHLHQVVNGGRANSMDTAEVAQEPFAPRATNTRNTVERGAQALLAPQLTMVGYGEPVRFIAYALEEKECRRVAFENHWVLASRQKDALLAVSDLRGSRVAFHAHLGQSNGIDLGDLEIMQHLERHIELPL